MQPTTGTQCLSRSSGQDAPTADARRLFAPTAFPKKANCEEFVFRSTGEAPQKQGKNLLKTGSHPSASAVKKKSIE